MPTLKELREKLFLSQEDLAHEAGVAKSTINRLEKGLEKPKFVTIRRLAKALGVEPGQIDFLGTKKEIRPPPEVRGMGWPAKRSRPW